ncbi:hypothetical protein AEQ67_09880 [Pseudomonas sp. RIT-PI-q]|nr:hypothetical protein AEQ67_09880 [Pseudomonas sp. RIT-PI-q]
MLVHPTACLRQTVLQRQLEHCPYLFNDFIDLYELAFLAHTFNRQPLGHLVSDHLPRFHTLVVVLPTLARKIALTLGLGISTGHIHEDGHQSAKVERTRRVNL